MDQERFEMISRAVGATVSRRRGLAAALGAVLGGGALAAGDVAAGRRRPKPEGPCGNGSRKDNVCAKDGDCCTGYCKKGIKNKDGAGRCRCIRKGQTCTAKQTCCGANVCVDGTCAPPLPPCTVLDSGNVETNGAALVAALGAAADGATITVEPGTYQADYLITKNVTLQRCGSTGEAILTNTTPWSSTENVPNDQGRVIRMGVPPTMEAPARERGAARLAVVTLTLVDMVVERNVAAGNGGGIFVGDGAALNLLGSTQVRGSKMEEQRGGGLHVLGGIVVAGCDRTANPGCTDSVMIGSTDPATGNIAKQGGGIYSDNFASITLQGNATVTGNTSHGSGGGVNVDDDVTFVGKDDASVTNNLTVADNSSSGSGAGMYLGSSAGAVTLLGNFRITGNDCSNEGESFGGGIFMNNGNIMNDPGSLFSMADTVRITGNYAISGGGIFQDDTNSTPNGVTSTTVSGNLADATCDNYYQADGQVCVF
jgi:hypothetical protein